MTTRAKALQPAPANYPTVPLKTPAPVQTVTASRTFAAATAPAPSTDDGFETVIRRRTRRSSTSSVASVRPPPPQPPPRHL